MRKPTQPFYEPSNNKYSNDCRISDPIATNYSDHAYSAQVNYLNPICHI